MKRSTDGLMTHIDFFPFFMLDWNTEKSSRNFVLLNNSLSFDHVFKTKLKETAVDLSFVNHHRLSQSIYRSIIITKITKCKKLGRFELSHIAVQQQTPRTETHITKRMEKWLRLQLCRTISLTQTQNLTPLPNGNLLYIIGNSRSDDGDAEGIVD